MRYLVAVPRNVLRGQHTRNRVEICIRSEVSSRQIKTVHLVLHRAFFAGNRWTVRSQNRGWLSVYYYHAVFRMELLIRRHFDIEFHVTATWYRCCGEQQSTNERRWWILSILNQFCHYARRRKRLAIQPIYARRIIEMRRKLIECTSWYDLRFICATAINVTRLFNLIQHIIFRSLSRKYCPFTIVFIHIIWPLILYYIYGQRCTGARFNSIN